MTKTRTLEQLRAEAAYNAARNAGSKAKEYKSFAKKLPMLIKNNGLGAAFAFAEKNGKGIDRDIKDWLANQSSPVDFPSDTNISEWLATVDSQEYRSATIEVMAYLNWLRRFVDTLIID